MLTNFSAVMKIFHLLGKKAPTGEGNMYLILETNSSASGIICTQHTVLRVSKLDSKILSFALVTLFQLPDMKIVQFRIRHRHTFFFFSFFLSPFIFLLNFLSLPPPLPFIFFQNTLVASLQTGVVLFWQIWRSALDLCTAVRRKIALTANKESNSSLWILTRK